MQWHEFFVTCQLGDTPCKEDSFNTFFDPYYFNCFTYSPPRDFIKRDATFSEGVENGWSAMLFTGNGMLDINDEIRILPGLHEFTSPVSASEGLRVVIHPPDTQPFPFTEGFDVPPGHSASLGIKANEFARIGPPHGNCRHDNPFNRNTSDTYRVITCEKMCRQQYIIATCGCYDAGLPRIPEAEVSSCRSVDALPDSCMYNATEACLESLINLNNKTACSRSARNAHIPECKDVHVFLVQYYSCSLTTICISPLTQFMK